MTEGSPLRLIAQFSLPLLAGNIFQQAYNMVDAAIVGRVLGSASLGAVGASGSVQFLILGFCFGLTAGFTIPVAQRFGARTYAKMRRYIFHSVLLTLMLSALVTLVCSLLCARIIRWISTPEEIFREAYLYLLVIFLGVPFTLFYNLLSGILRAVGDSRTPFMFLVVSSVLNIGLDLLFIVVFGWGVVGAALATILSQAVSAVLCMILILARFELLHLKPEDCSVRPKYIARLLYLGIPMGLQFSITAIGSIVIQVSNNRLGSLYVSAFAAGNKIKQLGISPFDAVASAVSTYASQNYGAGNIKRIRRGLFEGTLLSLGLAMVVVCPAMIFLGRPLSMIFIPASETDVLLASARYVRLMGCFFWLISLLQIFRLTIQGLGFSNLAIFSGVFEMIARCSVGFGLVPAFGFDAIIFADPAAWLSAVLWCTPVLLWCLHRISRARRI